LAFCKACTVSAAHLTDLLRNGTGGPSVAEGVNLTPPSNTEVKNERCCISTPSICLHGMDRVSCTLFNFTLQMRAEVRVKCPVLSSRVRTHCGRSVIIRSAGLQLLQVIYRLLCSGREWLIVCLLTCQFAS
jgi:hypothetical protein